VVGIPSGELSSLAAVEPTETLLQARLDALRDRVQALRDASSDAPFQARCDAEAISIGHLRDLIPGANASTLRAVLAMVLAKASHIQSIEELITERDPPD
jgi:hypothetical protein